MYIHTYIYTLLHISLSLSIYIYIYRERERERELGLLLGLHAVLDLVVQVLDDNVVLLLFCII